MNAMTVAFPDHIVPFDQIIGAGEVADLLTRHLGREVTASMVSTWALRADTTRFPDPLPIHLRRGLLWDRRTFFDGPEADGVLVWTGPPGRWPTKIINDAPGA